MTTIRENLGHGNFLDEEGDVQSSANIEGEFDRVPVANESIIQGTNNLARERLLEEEMERFETDARKSREQAIAARALAEAGPHSIVGEHLQTGLKLLDAISDMTMYTGGEKGGYKTKNFNDRYKDDAPKVESGARRNHQILVNKTFPELLKASQLIDAGFADYEVADMVNEARMEMKHKFGGPENEKTRSQMRASLKKS